MRKVLTQELVDYVEGMYFRVNTYENIIQLSYIPSKYVEIDASTKDHYAQKLIEARFEYNEMMKELKQQYFPEAGDNSHVFVDFSTRTISLQESTCSCGGSCSQ